MASVSATKGYILEEVLAKLLKNAGYDLIGESLEPENLKRGAHGLQVRGRGAWHQVDSLGQFRWTPPFNFPIRLFLEAKFWNTKAGVDLVRQAIGISADVNQRITATHSDTDDEPFSPSTVHRYSYALASTMGFTKDAASLALAHQISLIDLKIPEYEELLARIEEVASSAVEMWKKKGGKDMSGRLAALRYNLRTHFGTPALEQETDFSIAVLDAGEPTAESLAAMSTFADSVEALTAAVGEVSELFLGTASGPFFLLLKADQPQRFLDFARANRRHRVRIGWRGTVSAGQIWTIQPDVSDDAGYKLTFALPPIIADWILAQDDPVRRSARAAKENFLSRITIYRANELDGDELFQLEYDPSLLNRRG